MAESIMLVKAKDFAVEIVKLCRNIKETKHESVLTNQLLRSGTSVGANIHESKYASIIVVLSFPMSIGMCVSPVM